MEQIQKELKTTTKGQNDFVRTKQVAGVQELD